MAWITRFEERAGAGRIQPSQVVGLVKVFEIPEGGRVIQIDTNGSEDRKNPGKQSQTIQIGRESARELFDVLKRTYQFT
jgi:hypothetical protein